ncbi:MAG: transglycosylase SLT domain-containing protein [Poseidonibacter sp.]
MNKILLIIFLCLVSIFSNLSALNFNKKDYEILKDLNLEKSFIHDEHLQDLYNKLSSKSYFRIYKRNLKNASIYIAKIKEVLNQEGLPTSFLYLSMAESNFKLDAKSSTNALGLWQFMPSTAKLYNLRNDEYVDERLDFVKSTHAASKYLRHHHKRFDKWYLAILAYNCGEGRVIEAITRASIDKYIQIYPNKANSKTIKEYRKTIKEYLRTKKDFYKINKIYKKLDELNIHITARDLLKVQKNLDRQYLPGESRAYLRKIVVLSMIANRNFLKKGYIYDRDINSTLTTVKAKGGLHLRSIANVLEMDFNKLAQMNLHIKQYIIPSDMKKYDINIPYLKLERYNKNKNKIRNDSFVIYHVKKGDTLSSIGSKFKVKYTLIKKFNELKTNKLLLKQKLVIPVYSYKTKTVNKKYKRQVYKVQKGDSLSAISYKFRVSIKKLKQDNKLKSNQIKVGDKIAIYK